MDNKEMNIIKINKTPLQIKKIMIFWKNKRVFNFKTNSKYKSSLELYDSLDLNLKNKILNKFRLNINELIVFIIKNGEDEYIINTTERFINVSNEKYEEIYYTDFEKIGVNKTASIKGFKRLRVAPKYRNCYLIKRDGEVFVWKILYDAINPLIKSTKRCELIGRKYNLIKTAYNKV